MRAILLALGPMLSRAAKKSEAFRAEVAKHNCVYQIRLQNNSVGRYYTFRDGKISSKAGVHPNPDAAMVFKTIDVALKLLSPKPDMHYRVHAAKSFLVMLEGSDEIGNWMAQLVQAGQREAQGFSFGDDMGGGVTRYVMNTNGGPIHVHVKDGKILRTTPIVFDEKDAPSWSIQARGETFKPRRQTQVAPHAISVKSAVYSESRILHPMKRVDFDPDGERNPQNRGISGYERISWDEAFDIVG
ncbi:MAG: pyrogallol hydroxytransferase large subunit, partial [Pseudomonadota bacterium]